MKFTGLVRKFALLAALALAPAASFAGVFISVGFAPPALPVYTQPICPGDGYIWTPGYWAYGDDGYYWVPGVWVEPPSVGLLWTPGYWGWGGSAFVFHEGYWGPHVGFYGGINYGFGYGGVGFFGGEWRGGHFAYNTAYSNVNTTIIHNTYINRTTINNTTINNIHTSYNGGNGGIQARPSPQEAQFEHEQHIPPTTVQQSHVQAARAIPANFAKANGGHPAMAAIQRPGAMNTAISARGAVPLRAANQQARVAQGARSGQMTAGETRNVEGREASIHNQAATDRAANNGRLTPQEHQQINQRQNNVSGSIYNDKHNAAVQRPNAAVQQGGRSAYQGAPREQTTPRQQQAPRPQPAARPEPAARPQPAQHAEPHGEGNHGHR